MTYGIDVAGSTIRHFLEDTSKLYVLHKSYVQSFNFIAAYSTNDANIHPRFFRVVLPNPECIVTVQLADAAGYGTSLSGGSSTQIIAKTWKDRGCEIYMVKTTCPIRVSIYSPISMLPRNGSSQYGVKINASNGTSYLSTDDELLFPYAVGQPNLIKGISYPKPVSAAISRVGGVAAIAAGNYYQEGNNWEGTTSRNEARYNWFTAVYFTDQFTPVGDAVALAQTPANHPSASSCGVTMFTKDHDGTGSNWTYLKRYGLWRENKLPSGAIMITRAPNLSTVS